MGIINVEPCERCDSSIAYHTLSGERRLEIWRHNGQSEEYADVRLCSTCLDELWDWVFDEGPDRSDAAGPVPLSRMAESVQDHINDLEAVLDAIEGAEGEVEG